VIEPEAEGGTTRTVAVQTPQPTRPLAGAFALLATANALGQLIGFVALVYVAHSVPQTALGAYTVAAAIVTYVATFTNLGVSVTATREIAARPAAVASIARESIALLAAINAIAFLALVGAGDAISPNPTTASLLPIAGLALITNAFLVDWALQGLERFTVIALGRIAGQVLFGLLVFALISPTHGGIETYAYANVAGYALTTCFLLVALIRSRGLAFGRMGLRPLIGRFKRGVAVGISLVVLQLYLNIGTLLLGFLDTTAAVATYAVASKLPLAVLSLSAVMNSVLYPRIAAANEHDLDAVMGEVRAVIGVAIVAAAALTGLAIVNGDYIIEALFGSPYAGTGATFALLVGAAGVMFVDVVMGSALIARGRERYFTAAVVVCATAQLAFSAVLIPSTGASGAAAGLLLAEVLLVTLISRRLSRVLGRMELPYRTLGRATVVGLSVVAAGLLLQAQPSIVRLIVTCGCACVLAIALGRHEVREVLDQRQR
jgi:O-antigen/teichoic acid export membrane protein